MDCNLRVPRCLNLTSPDSGSYFKAKSDYVLNPLVSNAFGVLAHALSQVQSGTVAVMFYCYGGAISRVPATATAFAHRKALYSIQYFTSWGGSADTDSRLRMMRELYQSMRSHVSVRAYVNYCDLDLVNPLQAYHAENLARLMAVKKSYDPGNFLTHAQGIPGSRS